MLERCICFISYYLWTLYIPIKSCSIKIKYKLNYVENQREQLWRRLTRLYMLHGQHTVPYNYLLCNYQTMYFKLGLLMNPAEDVEKRILVHFW